jgi:hypothetical protein
MNKFKNVNNILGWSVFLVAAVVYLLTIEPTASLWDCGEFISTSYKLEVGHPPGAPLFMLVARIFSLIAGSHTDKVAMMVNSMSALASAFTIMFLFWSITHLAVRLMGYRNGLAHETGISKLDEISLQEKIIIFGSGLVGALAYTFSDTFWFSAVEGEVYASSSLFTAVVFWAILKWENEADNKYANRWLILIAYLMGLSIGVHLLNLLAIPAIVMVYYFRKYETSTWGTILALIVSFLLLGIMMYVIIPGVVWLASRFELIFVNGFGLPYNSGFFVYLILLLGGLAYGIWKTHQNKKPLFNTVLLMFTVILIGYSSFTMIVIRAAADTPMDENNPDNAFSLQYYLNREQYGDRPLIYGQYFNARPNGIKEGKSEYSAIHGKYKVTNTKMSYTYDPKYTTLFPRMWSSEDDHVDVYREWAGLKESQLYEPRRDAQGNVVHDNSGNILYDHGAPNKAPTFSQNLKFFFTYQVGHMYFRYFMWNFVGRQNDSQGFGDPLNGNWISGIKPIDEILCIGNPAKMPDSFKHTPSRNAYYFLPLLLGLFGLIYQMQRDNKNFWVVMLLFILTGLAIVVYLNQTPNQPRERDYAYAGSFYAFAIWIGLGVMAIYDSLSMKLRKNFVAVAISLVCLFLVPGIMAHENWNDHDRSGRYTTRDIARDYLESCASNAILFTNGDNDTFPLWYCQEVEGIRTDVRVVNLMLLNMDWHIDQMKRKAYTSDVLPISLSRDKYINGTRDIVFVQERMQDTVDAQTIMEFITSDDPKAKVQSSSGEEYNFVPTRHFMLPVDRETVLENGTVSQKDRDKIIPAVTWTFNRGSLSKSDLIVLDILANNHWKRPIYFASLGQEGTLGLENYMQLEGLAYRLVPIKTPTSNRYEAARIETDRLYDNLMNKFQYGRMNQPDVYLDDFHVRTLSVIRLRTRFAQLANELINQGDTLKAVQVLDRGLDLTPNDKIPYDHTIIPMIEAYYRCKKTDKANELTDALAQICNNKLSYYLDQNQKFIASINDEIMYNFQIMQNLSSFCKKFNQKELCKKLDDYSNAQYSAYAGKMNYR